MNQGRPVIMLLFLATRQSRAFCQRAVSRVTCRGAASTAAKVASSQATKIASEYDASQITVLEGLEAVRKRPGMYIGSTGPKGLHHLVFEILDNAVDEVMAGHANRVDVILNKDGSCTVIDDGRGIPCDIHPQTGKSTLETVLCVLHAGGKFGGENSGYRVSGGLHGVGLSVVNALSTTLNVTVQRDGKAHSMSFAQGKPTSELVVSSSGDAKKRGTTIQFFPDGSIFSGVKAFTFDVLAERMDELAYLNAGARIGLRDERKKAVVKKEFYHEGGMSELADKLVQGSTPLHAALGPSSKRKKDEGFVAKGSKNGIEVECALRWSSDLYSDVLVSFANGIRTSDGGTHVEGLRTSVTRTINAAAKKAGKLKADNLPAEYIREGLTAVLLVNIPEPEFEGQTKTRLGSPGVRAVVDSIVGEHLTNLFDFQPKALAAIVEKAQRAQSAALAARKARDMVRRKSIMTSTVLPGKLADCSSREKESTEIFIVEGDSAAGSAKQGRDRELQAILPLRGKILNIEKCPNERIYSNTELQALMSALGLGVRGEAFDPKNLRYRRIIIMTDADVDGAHIRTLILTFFYRYQRNLIHGGHVYIACPPLYKVTSGKKVSYCWTDDEKEAKQKSSPNADVQRFKGLGEMMAKELWQTTMNPSTRILQRVDVEDAAQADKIISLFMGDRAADRKEYIMDKSDTLGIDDIDI